MQEDRYTDTVSQRSENTQHSHFLEITDEDKLLDACMALKSIGKEYQQEFLRKAIRNREYYLGNQYLKQVGDRLEYRRRTPGNEWRPQTTRNVIGQSIDPIHAIMAAASPSINVEACFPDDPVTFSAEMPQQGMARMQRAYQGGQRTPTQFTGRETAERFTEYHGDKWNSPYRKEYHARGVSLLDALISGISFRGYSVKEHPMRGTEVIVKNLQPHQVLLDPEGRDTVTFEDFRFIILISWLDVMTLRNYFGAEESEYGNPNDDTLYDTNTASGFISRIFRRGQQTEELRSEWGLRRYPVYTLYYAGWMPDLLTPTVASPQRDAKFPYPRGRVVTWINDRKVVEDRDVETWGFTFPIVAFSPNFTPHTGYPQSDVDKLIGPQDLINAFSNIIVSNAILTGHTQLLVEAGAIDPQTWTVSPGKIMRLSRDALRAGRIKQLMPGPLGGELVQFMLNLEHFAKEEIGDSDGLLRGNAPGSVTSGLHARTIQESAFNRQSYRIGMLDASYEIGVHKETNLTQQYVSLSNPYHRGYMGIEPGLDLAMQNLMFKVAIESRKDLPFSSGGQFELYFAMLRNGDITHKEFFELAKFHVSEEWKKKVEDAAKNAVPGMPPELLAQMQVQAESEIAAAASATPPGPTIGAQGGQVPGAGGGQQAVPGDQQVGSVDAVGGVDTL